MTAASRWFALQRTNGRLRFTETQILIGLAFLVGVGAGLGAVGFRELIALFTWVFFTLIHSRLLHGHRWLLPLIPALGALLFSPLIRYFAPEARGHGVPEVMLAVALNGGRMRPAVVIVKALASAINIGSGGSVGREGPIVQVGSAIGSSIGQFFHMSDLRVRSLVAAGAAGGIAATFNAPFAGAFFALEVIMQEFNVRNFSLVVVASATADVIGRAFFGVNASFAVPPYTWHGPLELPLYLLLGCLAAVTGVAFMRFLYLTEDLFDGWKGHWLLKPILGGLLLGLLAIVIPAAHNSVPSAILAVGYPTMSAALAGKIAIGLAVLLLVAKLLAVSLTIGSGGSGGVFAPSLYLGAMLGTVFGQTAHILLPGVVGNDTNAYALAGMAAVFAGAAHAPITSIMILFELTNDYRLMVPLMITVVVATLVGRALSAESIYTLKLFRRGIKLSDGKDVNVLRTLHVSDAMTTDVDTLLPTATVQDFVELVNRRHLLGFPVVDDAGNFCGMVRVEDVEEYSLANQHLHTVAEIMQSVSTVYPDETLEAALDRLGVQGQRRIPVVAREDPCRLVGILHSWDVLNAYQARLVEAREQRGPTGRVDPL